jgi:hypothetical protein
MVRLWTDDEMEKDPAVRAVADESGVLVIGFRRQLLARPDHRKHRG